MTSSVLIWFLLVGSALTALKLYRTGLYRSYPIFFAYFIFRIPEILSPIVLNTKSDAYLKTWICIDVIVLTFYILLVRELYRLVLAKYKGLYTLGRWAMYCAVVVSVTISALSLIPRIKPNVPQRSRILTYVIATDRGVNTALVIFIVLLLLFLSRYPVSLSRNVRVYALIYSIFFLSNVFVTLMRSLFGLRLIDTVNDAHLAVAAVCVVAWLFLLTPQGEENRAETQIAAPQFEHRLLTQLDSLNAALLKVGQRQAAHAISHKS